MAKQIKLVKSLIGRKSDQIATAHSLGLKKIGQVTDVSYTHLFGVEVTKVNTLNCQGRARRVGRFEGKKADWKKAIVTINQEPDDKKVKSSIEFFDGLY